VDTIKKFDTDSFYRMEANFHRTVNDPIGTGYMGISHSSSTMNAPALKMLQKFGYAYGGHYTKYDGATYMTDALFDIRYLMEKTGNTTYVDSRIHIPEEYKITTEITTGDTTYKFYRNPNALGLGIVTGTAIFDTELGDDDPFDNQNRIFNALTGENKQYFKRLDAQEDEMNNLFKETLVDGHMKYYVDNTAVTDSHVDYLVKMDSDSGLYMFLPTTYERNCNIWVQDEKIYQQQQSPMDFAGQFFVVPDSSSNGTLAIFYGSDFSILVHGSHRRIAGFPAHRLVRGIAWTHGSGQSLALALFDSQFGLVKRYGSRWYYYCYNAFCRYFACRCRNCGCPGRDRPHRAV
jgi:hypothetical protein